MCWWWCYVFKHFEMEMKKIWLNIYADEDDHDANHDCNGGDDDVCDEMMLEMLMMMGI